MSELVLLEDIKTVARGFLELKPDDEIMFDVAMATYYANKMDSDPLWVFFIGPPSSAKTEVCMSMEDYPGTFYLSSLTKNSFLSGKEKYKGTGDDKKEVDCSVLHRMNKKLVVIKDFTTVLSLHSMDRTEIYSQLREIYDGKYDKAYGNSVFRKWKGKIGILAGVTPSIDQQSSVSSLLGERFLYYRVGGGDRMSMAMENSTGIGDHRRRLQEVTVRFMKQLDGFTEMNWDELHPNMVDKLATLAIFCAAARAGVERNSWSKIIEVFPNPEGPARLAKQFKIMALSLAVVRNQRNVDDSIYKVVCKIARDSMPETRFRVLKALWRLNEEKEDWYSTSDVSQRAGLPRSTTLKKLEDLHLLKLIAQELGEEVQVGGKDHRPYLWCPSNDLISMAQITSVLA
jgi:hypothetical protein